MNIQRKKGITCPVVMSFYLTIMTVQRACWSTPFVTFPIKNLFSQVLPLVPITIDLYPC